MAAQFIWLSLLDGVGARVDTARFSGASVTFFSLREFMVLYREIFVRQEYSLPLNNPRPIIIDAGANIGMTTLYCKLRWPEARVVAFEPGHATFHRLRANVERNHLKDVELLNEAIGGQDGMVSLIRTKGSCESHAASISVAECPGSVSEPVYCSRLSKVVDSLGAVDLLKIDIEGAEYDVLAELEQSRSLLAVRLCISSRATVSAAGLRPSNGALGILSPAPTP